MHVFRLSRKKYANQLNGRGAAKFGNRWNSKGIEIIYTAESRALAMAEVIVHLNLASLPSDFMILKIEIPNQIKIKKLAIKELSKNWNLFPQHMETQKLGDAFIDASEACILKVPSAVVQGDFNYLINPHHPDFKKIKITSLAPFPFDQRIFK
ncbi:RES family NAD+ phosphorylase [Psychroflexus salis]|uniref:RES domain-containing protein n=1 Tax=Psychroflexus salis TaxID=1526574 RepID=A0A917A0R1_9FLAO|nr:RES family NAD+ phosphorylase [Psychroflexus salis]GGE21362.1 hypothetical protein GCM10010831_23010 [Psychroflexus salis]